MKQYYLTVNPFTLTNIETGEIKNYENLEKLLDGTLVNSSKIYVYELNKLISVFADNLLNRGYTSKTVSETTTKKIGGKIPSKSFLSVANPDDATMLRVRKNTNIQSKFFNASKLFGGATVKDIVSSVGETEENIGMALALKKREEKGFHGWTLGGDALQNFKDLTFKKIGENGKDYTEVKFRDTFPRLDKDVHNFVMSSFQGGLCYINPKYRGKEVKKGGVEYDVNSMYPSVMLQEYLPYGTAARFEGKYEHDMYKPLYFQEVHIKKLKLKWKGIPCIKNRDDEGYYKEASNVTLVLNHIDIEMMFDNYKVKGIEYKGGYKFRQTIGIFDEYINYWKEQKINAKTEYDKMIAKKMLNNLFGKFATKIDKKNVQYKKTNSGKTASFVVTDTKAGNMVYAPVGTYITSYARQRLIKAIKANGRKFVYSDTDSIYIIGNEVKGIEVHKTKFGAWKKEFEWTRMNIVGKKQYVVEKDSGKIKVACSGMPAEVIKDIKNYDDFALGKVFEYVVCGFNKQGMKINQTQRYELKDENIF